MSGELIPPIIVDIVTNAAEATAGLAEFKGSVSDMAASVDASTGDIATATDAQVASVSRVGEAAVVSADAVVAAQARVDAAMAEVAAATAAASDVQVGSTERVAAAAGLGTGKLAALEDVLGTVGLSMGGVSDRANRMSGAAEKGGLSIQHMADNAGLSEAKFLALGAGILGVAGASVLLGVHMQTATTEIANSAQISVAAAQKIGSAFEGTAFTTQFSATTMAKAYAQVAGQLGETQGHALSAAQAMQVMAASMDLATAKGVPLATATSTLAGVMQAFGINAHGAAGAASALFVASNKTGQGVDTLSASLIKVKAGLGGMAPSLDQTSALLVDLADHGESGRKALSGLTTAFTAFLKPASEAVAAQDQLKTATAALPPSLRSLAAEYQNLTLSGKALTTATQAMPAGQAALWKAFTASADAAKVADQAQKNMGITALDSQHKFVGLASVIGQLHDQIKGMSTAQATAQLTADGFGSSASKMLGVIQAGPGAFDKATASVSKQNAAQQASAKAAHDLAIEFKTMVAGIEDLGTEIGTVLIPPLTDIVTVGGEVLGWIVKTEPALIALGAVVAYNLGIPVARFVANEAIDFIQALGNMGAGAITAAAEITGLDLPFANTTAAERNLAAATGETATAIQTGVTEMQASWAELSATTTASIAETNDVIATLDMQLRGLGVAAASGATEVDAAMASMVGSVTAADTAIEAENVAAGLSFTDLIPGVGLVAIAVGALTNGFGLLGSSESVETQVAKATTAAKNAEAQAIQNAANAAFASDNSYFAMKNAQIGVTQAVKEYGPHSLQARQATLQLQESTAAYAQSQSAATAKTNDATSATAKLVTTTGQAVQLYKQMVGLYGTGSKYEADLTAEEQKHTAALNDYQTAVAQADVLELNHQRSIQGTTLLTGDAIDKTRALGAIYTSLPKTVQTKLAADSTDALAKISGLVQSLKQQGVGTPTIAKILGDSTNAQQAISDLTAKLDSLPSAFQSIGVQAGQGLAAGLNSQHGNVAAAAASLSSAATVSARVTLKTHSPSEVFRDIGMDVGQGFADGMTASIAKVRGASKALVAAAIPPNTPTLEPAGAPGTASANAQAAPSDATSSAEQDWATQATAASQAFVTAQTSAANKEVQAIQGAANKHVAAIQSAESAIKNASAAQRDAATNAANAVRAKATAEETAARAGYSSQSSIVKQGTTQLNSIISAIQSGSASTLNKTLSGITQTQMQALVSKLATVHHGEFATMAGQIETVWQQGMDALAAANQAAADKAYGTLVTDSANGQAKAITDAAQISSDTATASAQALTDSTQVTVDTLAEAGLTGAQLTAAQAKVTLDQITQTNNAAIAAAKLNVDQVTQSSDAAIASAQAGVDQASSGSALAQAAAQLVLSQAEAAQTVALAQANAAEAAAQATATTQEASAQANVNITGAATTTTPGAAITINMLGTTTDPLTTAQQLYVSLRPYLLS